MNAWFSRLWKAALLAAAVLAGPAPAAALHMQERIGGSLPAQAGFLDEHGRALRLGSLFGARPLVLVPGYYHCPNLCSTLFQGVFEALNLSGLPPADYALVGVSIDPDEGPADAARRKAAYTALQGSGGELRLLTGSAASIAQLTAALGIEVTRDARSGQYLHPAVFAVVTPDGRIARYFTGVRFAPRELRAAVQAAAQGQPGAADSAGDTLPPWCGHLGRALGLHSAAAMNAVRASCLAVLLLGGAWLWRRRYASRGRGSNA